MNKDIIYIDVEDDITAIIGKVKDASERVVALVPPKHVGVLQSAVNLRLLARAAKQADKRLVLITNNVALTALAAAAQLPIAKNLQSKPEIAQIPALDIDDGNDIIDGSQLSIGELARTADSATSESSTLAGSAIVDEVIRSDKANAKPPAPGQLPARAKAKSGAKVPNFNKFRKKLMIIGASLVAFIGLLIWAFVFAPHATVLITARTTDSSMNKPVIVGTALATDMSAGTIKAVTHEMKKDVSVDIAATGTKDVGEKATGTVKIRPEAEAVLVTGFTVPAGTEIQSSSGSVFTTDGAVVFEKGDSAAYSNGINVGVTAANNGSQFNGASGSASTSASGVRSVAFIGTTSGGTDKTIKVVTAEDVERATVKLNEQDNADIKRQLTDQFGKDATVIDASFKADQSAVKAAPAVGEEAADSKGKLAGSVSYTLTGVTKAELSNYLKAHFEQQVSDEDNQRVYDDGSSKVTFTNVEEKNNTFSANLSATAKIGPKISDSQVKELAKGKKYGEVQSAIVAIQGVDNVDIKFSYFWVRTVPNDENKISVEFNLDESN